MGSLDFLLIFEVFYFDSDAIFSLSKDKKLLLTKIEIFKHSIFYSIFIIKFDLLINQLQQNVKKR